MMVKNPVSVKPFLAKFVKIKLRQDALEAMFSNFKHFLSSKFWPFGPEGVFQQTQAIPQICAFPSPFPGILNAKGM